MLDQLYNICNLPQYYSSVPKYHVTSFLLNLFKLSFTPLVMIYYDYDYEYDYYYYHYYYYYYYYYYYHYY